MEKFGLNWDWGSAKPKQFSNVAMAVNVWAFLFLNTY